MERTSGIDKPRRQDRIRLMAESMIVAFGERALEVAQKQVRDSVGEVRASWVSITEDIERSLLNKG